MARATLWAARMRAPAALGILHQQLRHLQPRRVGELASPILMLLPQFQLRGKHTCCRGKSLLGTDSVPCPALHALL